MTQEPLVLRLRLIGRYVLLMGAIIGCFVFATYQYASVYIDILDRKLVAHYVNYYRHQFDVGSVQAKEAQSVDLLEILLTRLDETRRGDRLALIKENSLEMVTAFYLQKSQLDEALYWAKKWIRFDERNLTAAIRLYSIQYKIPEYRAEAILALEALRQRVPEVEIVSKTSAVWAMEDHRYLDALKVCKTFSERAYETFDRPWAFFWDTGGGFKASQTLPIYPSVMQQNEAKFEARLPAGIVRLRLDPPSKARYLIRDSFLRWDDPAGGELAVLNQKLGLHDIELRLGGLETTGGTDPYFYWKMPASFSSKRRVTHFETHLDRPLPQWVEEVMLGSSAEQIKDAVGQASDADLTDFYIRTRNQIQGPQVRRPSQLSLQESALFSVYWSLDEKNFSPKRIVRNRVVIGSHGRFQTHYTLNESVRKIRFDFPDSSDAEIEIEQLILTIGSTQIQIDPLVAKYVLMHNISRNGNSFSLHGNDPHFAIELKEAAVDSVYLKGTIR